MRVTIRLVIAAGVLAMWAPAARADANKNPGQGAKTHNESILSRYTEFKYSEAADLIEQFVPKYPTNEYVPANLVRLAHCYAALGKWDKFDAPVEDCIKRFPGSRFWFYAYGLKLWRLKETKENDKYLAAAEAMIKSAGDVPARLMVFEVLEKPGKVSPLPWYTQAWPPDFPRNTWMRLPLGIPRDWAQDFAAMADTPERAGRGLKILQKLLDRKPPEIALDWQYVHVALLAAAGDADKSAKQLEDYLTALDKDTKDYRAIDLIALCIEHARARKDDKTVTALTERLVKDFGNCVSTAEPLQVRLTELLKAKRWDEYIPLAKVFFANFPTAYAYRRNNLAADVTMRWQEIVREWVPAAEAAAKAGDAKPATELLSAFEQIEKARTPHIPERSGVLWKFRMNMAAGRYPEALKLAQQLVGDTLWCDSNFSELVKAADSSRNAELKALVDQTRKARGVPAADSASPAGPLLAKLRDHIKEGQERMAEEVIGAMWEKHKNDPNTIDGVSAIFNYYFQKVLAEPRDKWINRMMEAYPQHPLTQRAINFQIKAEVGQRTYERVGSIIDTATAKFPGAADQWVDDRVAAYFAVKDLNGAVAYMRKIWAARLEAGDTTAVDRIQSLQSAILRNLDNKAAGAEWTALAKKLAGTPAEPYCRLQAFFNYFERVYYNKDRNDFDWNGAIAEAKVLRTQTIDPEVRWQTQFAEVNVLSHKDDPTGALKAANEVVTGKQRDVYTRLDLSELGQTLGALPKPDDALPLVKKLEAACQTPMDDLAVLLMQGNLWRAAKKPAQAAPHYLAMAYKHLPPAWVYPYFYRGIECLRGTPQQATEIQKFSKATPNAQDVLPDLLYQWWKTQPANARANQQKLLIDKYPASEARDTMEDEIAAAAQPVKPPPKKN